MGPRGGGPAFVPPEYSPRSGAKNKDLEDRPPTDRVSMSDTASVMNSRDRDSPLQFSRDQYRSNDLPRRASEVSKPVTREVSGVDLPLRRAYPDPGTYKPPPRAYEGLETAARTAGGTAAYMKTPVRLLPFLVASFIVLAVTDALFPF